MTELAPDIRIKTDLKYMQSQESGKDSTDVLNPR